MSDPRATDRPETQTQEQTQTTQHYQTTQQYPVGATSPGAQDQTSTGLRRSPRISPPTGAVALARTQAADTRALGNTPSDSGPPFKELIPLEIASASEVEVMLKISEELFF